MFTRKTTELLLVLILIQLSIIIMSIEGLSVVKQELRVRSVSLAHTKFTMGTASILLDQDLYVPAAPTGPIGTLGLSTLSSYFQSTRSFITGITCSNTSETIPAPPAILSNINIFDQTIPLASYYVINGFDALNLISDIIQPDCVSPIVPSNRAITIAFPLQIISDTLGILSFGTRDPVAFLQSCKPQVTYNVTNSSGGRISTVIFSQVNSGFSCDEDAVNDAVTDQISSIKSFTPFGDVVGLMCADKIGTQISLSPIFQTYTQFLNSLFIKNVTYVKTLMKKCILSPTDPAYITDPCCFSNPLFPKCCYPRLFSIPQTKLILNETALQASASLFPGLSVPRLKQLLNDYAFSINNNGGVDGDNDNEEYNSALDDFTNTVAQLQLCIKQYSTPTDCSTDSDCPSGVACSSLTGSCSTFIYYPWVVEGLFNCTFDVVSQSTSLLQTAKSFFQKKLSITTTQQIRDTIYNFAIQPNCWGKLNENLTTSVSVSYNHAAPTVETIEAQPGECNKTQICYHNNSIITKINCEGVTGGLYYCGSCNDTRDPASCVAEFPELDDATKCGKGKCFYNKDNSVSLHALNNTLCNSTGSCSASICSVCKSVTTPIPARNCGGYDLTTCLSYPTSCMVETNGLCSTKTICENNGHCDFPILMSLPIPKTNICVLDISVLSILPSLKLPIALPTLNNCHAMSAVLFPGKCVLADALYTVAGTCVSLLGTLYNTDLTVPTCNLGSACVKDNIFTAGNQSECGLCGGTWVPRVKWTLYKWTPGKVLPLQWLPKKFGPVNFQQDGVSVPILNYTFSLVTASPLMRKITTAANTKYSFLSKIIDVLSSACSTNITADNFFGKGNSTYVTTVTPGLFAKAEAKNQYSVEICNDCDVASVNISLYPASFVALYSSLKRQSNDGSYSVVNQDNQPTTTSATSANSSGAVIGQIVGNGLEIRSQSGNSNGCNVTLFSRDDIQIENDKFTLFSIAQQFSDNEISVYDCTTIVSGNSVSCAVHSDGIYFPAYVRPDWKSYVPPKPTTSGSVSSTSGQTSTTAMTDGFIPTTSSSTSLFISINRNLIIMIVSVTLLLVYS